MGKKTSWSYQTGEWGRTRVRAYDRGARGMYLEYGERSATGRKRVRAALGRLSQEQAKAAADALASKFRHAPTSTPERLTLGQLFDIYEARRNVRKTARTRAHDRRCFEMFRRAFGEERSPETLSVLDWDQFITDRRSGALAPIGARKRRVRNRIIESDLALLVAVLS